MLFQDTKQNILVNGSKELPYVAFERPHSPCVIMGSLASKATEAVKSLMDSFIISARVRIGNEQSVKERIENAVNGTMDYSVSHSRFMDISGLGVGDAKCFVAGVAIGFGSEFPMDCKKVICEMKFKLFHVFAFVFPSDKLFPRLKEIFGRNDMMIIVR